jgi:hypothetical protein
MHALLDWLRNHPVGYPAILFLLTCIVEIYAGDIKRFLHKWPRTTAQAAARNSTIARLELLKSLQPGNTYNLLFYLAFQFITFVFQSLGIIIIADIVSVAKHWNISAGIYFAMIAGIFIGTCNTVRKVLWQLDSYPESVARLEKKLADAETQHDAALSNKREA